MVTTSVTGNLIGTDLAWYLASMAALMGYVRRLTAHRVSEFRSCGLAQGMTDTPPSATFKASDIGELALQRLPLGQMASPYEIAYAGLFVVSPAVGYINGVLLPVDGGWSITK